MYMNISTSETVFVLPTSFLPAEFCVHVMDTCWTIFSITILLFLSAEFYVQERGHKALSRNCIVSLSFSFYGAQVCVPEERHNKVTNIFCVFNCSARHLYIAMFCTLLAL